MMGFYQAPTYVELELTMVEFAAAVPIPPCYCPRNVELLYDDSLLEPADRGGVVEGGA